MEPIRVDIDRLYSHVLELEGMRHFRRDPGGLDRAADYIARELAACGAAVSEQRFRIEGVEREFRNVEGAVGGSDGAPEFLVTCHYDTMDRTPGANDNASGTAAMLEAARVLAAEPRPDARYRFVAFTLEELHPLLYDATEGKLAELDLTDGLRRYRTHLMHESMRMYNKVFRRSLVGRGRGYAEAADIAFAAVAARLGPKERAYFEHLTSRLRETAGPSEWVGRTCLVGSALWAERAAAEGRRILGALNLETIGFTSDRRGSQRMPSPLFRLLPRWKAEVRRGIGNFVAVVGDRNSRALARLFCSACRDDAIGLPYVNAALPFDFETLARVARDLLRSDHSPLWKAGIPALMITDSADFRYPFYHTEADTIDKLDFEFMARICAATVATARSCPARER